MKYLCMICADTVMEMMPDADAAKHYDEYAEFTRQIGKSDHFLSANRLKPVGSATTVKVRNGKVTVTDGPFAETEEQLAGFHMIEARDLHEAIHMASGIPPARVGCVEVRPVRPIRETVAREAIDRP